MLYRFLLPIVWLIPFTGCKEQDTVKISVCLEQDLTSLVHFYQELDSYLITNNHLKQWDAESYKDLITKLKHKQVSIEPKDLWTISEDPRMYFVMEYDKIRACFFNTVLVKDVDLKKIKVLQTIIDEPIKKEYFGGVDQPYIDQLIHFNDKASKFVLLQYIWLTILEQDALRYNEME